MGVAFSINIQKFVWALTSTGVFWVNILFKTMYRKLIHEIGSINKSKSTLKY